MTPAKFICLREHPENVRWDMGCGREWVGDYSASRGCPFCGGLYVKEVK
jgi:wobble nucleotide-excising tRNase